MIVKCENLSKKQRRLTPFPFCEYLLAMVWAMKGNVKTAILWTERKSLYWKFWPSVEIYGVGRDARKYDGPYPIIAHPPCGPWGKYKSNCHQSKLDGIIAMNLVHEFGGIVEQPLGSSLFSEHGCGGRILKMNQSDFGHMALKPTILYVF